MEQPPDLSGSPKVVQLTAAGSQRIFKEKISGATAERPQLKKLMATIGPDDLVVIPLSKAHGHGAALREVFAAMSDVR